MGIHTGLNLEGTPDAACQMALGPGPVALGPYDSSYVYTGYSGWGFDSNGQATLYYVAGKHQGTYSCYRAQYRETRHNVVNKAQYCDNRVRPAGTYPNATCPVCPVGSYQSGNVCLFGTLPPNRKDLGGERCSSSEPSLSIGNPVHAGTGNKYQVETDYSGFGVFPLSYQRYYNSSSAVRSAYLGAISQDQLYHQLQKQVEQIFFGSRLIREGNYVFVQPDESATPPVHAVHLPVQHLLMEGVQRIDEMALVRERIPHDDLVPEIQPRTSATSLDETAQTVLAWSDGSRTVEDIARETGLGQFLTVKALYGLVQQGLVHLRPKKTIDSVAVRKMVSQFNALLRDIFMAVATYGGMDQTRSTLGAWIVGSGYGPIFGPEGIVKYSPDWDKARKNMGKE